MSLRRSHHAVAGLTDPQGVANPLQCAWLVLNISDGDEQVNDGFGCQAWDRR
jgi:hypothetical protein